MPLGFVERTAVQAGTRRPLTWPAAVLHVSRHVAAATGREGEPIAVVVGGPNRAARDGAEAGEEEIHPLWRHLRAAIEQEGRPAVRRRCASEQARWSARRAGRAPQEAARDEVIRCAADSRVVQIILPCVTDGLRKYPNE
eukprot:SAG11_NODE_1736_length_4344_cov_1.763722_6_plen_140_part_00